MQIESSFDNVESDVISIFREISRKQRSGALQLVWEGCSVMFHFQEGRFKLIQMREVEMKIQVLAHLLKAQTLSQEVHDYLYSVDLSFENILICLEEESYLSKNNVLQIRENGWREHIAANIFDSEPEIGIRIYDSTSLSNGKDDVAHGWMNLFYVEDQKDAIFPMQFLLESYALNQSINAQARLGDWVEPTVDTNVADLLDIFRDNSSGVMLEQLLHRMQGAQLKTLRTLKRLHAEAKVEFKQLKTSDDSSLELQSKDISSLRKTGTMGMRISNFDSLYFLVRVGMIATCCVGVSKLLHWLNGLQGAWLSISSHL